MELIRQFELRDQPYPDSWPEGQRVARTTSNRSDYAAGQDRGNVGDLGTVVRFLQREDEPDHSLYLVRWDSYPMGTAYVTHRKAKAVNESARDIIDALDPKRTLRQVTARRRVWNMCVFDKNHQAFRSEDGDYVLHNERHDEKKAPKKWQAYYFAIDGHGPNDSTEFEAETWTIAANMAKAWANQSLA